MKNIHVIILIFLLFSCNQNNNERILNDFKRDITLVAEKIPIKEILNPIDIVVLEDYIVIQNERLHDEDCFFVYKKNAHYDFLYSFGRIGQGKGEFIAPKVVQNCSENKLSVFDNAHYTIRSFLLKDDTTDFIVETKITKRTYPIQEISYVNDSIIMFRAINNVENRLFCYNLSTNSSVDSVAFESSFSKKLGDSYNTTLDVFNFSNYKNKFISGFNYINDLKAGKLDSNFHFSDNNSYKLQNDNFTPTVKSKIYDNYFYYMFPVAKEKYIYAIYMGRKTKELQPFPINIGTRHFDSYIEVYDWSMNKIVRLKPDNDFIRISVDEKDNAFYTWNLLEDFDFLLKYNIDL